MQRHQTRYLHHSHRTTRSLPAFHAARPIAHRTGYRHRQDRAPPELAIRFLLRRLWSLASPSFRCSLALLASSSLGRCLVEAGSVRWISGEWVGFELVAVETRNRTLGWEGEAERAVCVGSCIARWSFGIRLGKFSGGELRLALISRSVSILERLNKSYIIFDI